MKKRHILVLLICLAAFIASSKLTLSSLSTKGNPYCTAKDYGYPLAIIEDPCPCGQYQDPATGKMSMAPVLVLEGFIGNIVFYFLLCAALPLLVLRRIMRRKSKSKEQGGESDTPDIKESHKTGVLRKCLMAIGVLIVFGLAAEVVLHRPARAISMNLDFFRAVEMSNCPGAIELIEKGMDIKEKDIRGLNALHIVKDPIIAAELIRRGADINAESSCGNTPLDSAYYDEIREFLRSHGAKTSKELKEQGK